MVVAIVATVAALLIWRPMLGGWWYVIDWYQWPYLIGADHAMDWSTFLHWLSPSQFSFGSKVTRPSYYLTTSIFLAALGDRPVWWFVATLGLFAVGVFSITSFVTRLAGPVFALFFGAFLLLHPMWSDIVPKLQSELFAFAGLSLAAFSAQLAAGRSASAKGLSLAALTALCSGIYGICAKENIALSAVVCLPLIALAILVYSRDVAARLAWLFLGWWAASLVMLAGIIQGVFGGKEARAADLYDREISFDAVVSAFSRWTILWVPLFGVFLFAVSVFVFLLFRDRAHIRCLGDVLRRLPFPLCAVLFSAAGLACALVNVACYRQIIEGRYLFPLTLLPWLVFAGLAWAFSRMLPFSWRGFVILPALVTALVATSLAWPPRAPLTTNLQAAERFARHTRHIRAALEAARDACLRKQEPKVVLVSHDFNDFEPVMAVDKLLNYLNVPGPRYLLRTGYSLDSATDDSRRFLWKLMDRYLEMRRFKRADSVDLAQADFVIQFSGSDKTGLSAPNLWPLYLHQD
jgi:hypothetical protein